MITVNNLSFHFGGQLLFKNVDLKFTPGNCYGIIGANGAGKSTFLRILCGELEPSTGEVVIPDTVRMSVLRQDHFAFDQYTVLDTVMMGNRKLWDVMKEKDAIYEKEDFTEADGIRASELEAEFAEMNGWEAESEVSRLIQGLGMPVESLEALMSTLKESEKVKVMLAQALFGNPDIVMLDEPTNGLDMDAVLWLEDFLSDYFGTVLVVSHDRHFLNDVCTNIVDIDYNGIKMYVGNYEFWYESSQLIQRMMKQQNKKAEEKIRELQTFISRFSANKSKSRQATSRRKLLDKLTVEELPASSRRYPFIGFDMDRVAGKDILFVRDLTKTAGGVTLFKDLSFTVNKEDKIALVGSEQAITALFRILMEEDTPDSGDFKWGVSITKSYFPHDNTPYFKDCDLSVIDWLGQYSKETTETYLRGFLGRMLFSGDSVFKPVKVLSGGERTRLAMIKLLLEPVNLLILDEPTNHLDLKTKEILKEALTAFDGTLIVVSHDRDFLDGLTHKIYEFSHGRVTEHLDGVYGFLRKKKIDNISEIERRKV